ncbi:MAG TPA: lipoprotein insertase outer membrane protein LolB [Xanthomonadaceae bacterium]|nr:lipoprotein insertase outer membrane protein LolB [Xanthomonadaceae bacterium]
MTLHRRVRGWLLVATLAMLSACAGRQPVREAPPVAEAAELATQEAREAALRLDEAWSLAGRVALANGDRGGSGRLDWRQSGESYSVSLSAPITRQSWRLSASGAGATLEGLEGGPRHGPEASGLLLRHTGWRIPVEALPHWLRGARAPGLGTAVMAFGADGRLARMEQGGWTIEFAEWGLPGGVATPGAAPGVALPHRLEAVRGDARVRLVVDAWNVGATAGDIRSPEAAGG